ncbi:MAG: 50S ribosomal protein L5 [Candidatus Aenigmarchaeota archaeon]|nr:50S ribosomal protein L5 [Candidatus Aenigmarchaeota archaeon]
MNPMREIRLGKVTVNMGVGADTAKLEKCKKIMHTLTKKKIVITSTHKRSTFGVAKNKPIGAKTTLRGEEAMEFLKKVLQGVENRIKESQFDVNGNFSFGIHEYINIPGIKYDPDVGIVGMDVAVTLERPGFRVKKRKIRPGKIGRSHLITREEAMEWARKNLGVTVE